MKFILLITLIGLAALFQNCGFLGGGMHGNGNGYGGMRSEPGSPNYEIPPSNVPPIQQVIAVFDEVERCEDGLTRARIAQTSDGYSLVMENCAPLNPSQRLPLNEVVQDGTQLVYQSRTFIKVP
jgi:hypothetical protein